MIERSRLQGAVVGALRSSPVVALLGPRQCGKTTLARALRWAGPRAHFDLENPRDLAALGQPMTTLESLPGLVVIDEVQRAPDLFQVLRVLADRPGATTRFLVLGSASGALLRQTSETLAGRVAFVDMAGLTLDETGADKTTRLWLRGGFPRSYTARSLAESARWRGDFIRTFLERDLSQLGVRVPATTMRRFWTMLAHHSSGVLNASQLGNALGEAHTTIRRHLDALASALVVRVLPPWFENLGKRQTKAPKVYVRDSGVLHTLLGIETDEQLRGHPQLGASWEGFVIEQLLTQLGTHEAYYWRTQAGAELDLLLVGRGGRTGVEVKFADAPRLTKSMTTAMLDLRLEHLFVVYPGGRRYSLAERVEAVPLGEAVTRLQ